MTLKVQKVNKNGKTYKDFFLAWKYEGKVYLVRVKPCFNRDMAIFMAMADQVPSGEDVEKYV